MMEGIKFAIQLQKTVTKSAKAKLLVYKDLDGIKLEFRNVPRTFYSDNPIKVDVGKTYYIDCIAEGSIPGTTNISIFDMNGLLPSL